MAIDVVVSGNLGDRRVWRQLRGAAHKEARAFAKTLSKVTTVYAARTRVNGRQVTRHFDRKIDAETWLAEQTLGKRRGSAIAPTRAQVIVEAYGRRTSSDTGAIWPRAPPSCMSTCSPSTSSRSWGRRWWAVSLLLMWRSGLVS